MSLADTKGSCAPSRMPIYLSTLLMPGAGQFLQRRWLPALFFSIMFLICFVFLVIEVVRTVVISLQSALAFMEGDPNRPYLCLSWKKILLPLGLSLILYVIGLCDTYFAYLRECRAWGERKLQGKLKVLTLLFASCFLPARLLAADPAELYQAITANDLPKVGAFLETCATGDVNSVIVNGATPLHVAAALNRKAMVGMLTAKGAAVDARTPSGFTPLHWAAGKDAVDTSTLLIQLGADINAQAAKGITPLHWAAGKNATNVVRLLIDSGADIEAKTERGLTPVHWAVMNNANEAAVMLAIKTVLDQMEKEQPRPDNTASGKTTEPTTNGAARQKPSPPAVSAGDTSGNPLVAPTNAIRPAEGPR